MLPTSVILFGSALFVRWLYCLSIFFYMSDAGLLGVDSHMYLNVGRTFAADFSTLKGLGFLGQSTTVMPLATWLLTFPSFLNFGNSALTYVLAQSVLDAGTCVLIYKIANIIDSRSALFSGIYSAVNPTQIIMSGLVYLDTPFIFCIALFFYGIVSWLRNPGIGALVLIVVAGTCATLIRAVAGPFIMILPILLFAALWLAGRLTRAAVLQICAIPIAFSLFLSPLLYRNGTTYGSWSLTSQGGLHLALWVVPLVWEAKDGKPWATGYAEMKSKVEQRPDFATFNPFEQSSTYTDVARLELERVGIFPILKSWTVGTAINIGAPAIVLSPPVSQLPRTGFYGTPGSSTVEKILNFIFRSENNAYSLLLLVGISGVMIVRVIQLTGFISFLRESDLRPILLILGFWVIYVFAANGPIASPKYRLPVEIPFCILCGRGIFVLAMHPLFQRKIRVSPP